MMIERIHIRPARQDDVGTIVMFNAALALETESRRLNLATLRNGTLAFLDSPGYGFYIVAELPEGKNYSPVGQLMITYEWSDWRNGVFWWIQSVYVDPAHRRQGVFAALYRHVERLARATPGVIGLRLYVERDNIRAQSTYASLGMVDAGYRIFEAGFA